MKYVLLVLVLLAAGFLFFGLGRPGRGGGNDDAARRTDAPRDASNAPGVTEASDTMVACAHCGVHLPRADALNREQRSYCSAAHLQAGPRSAPPTH